MLTDLKRRKVIDVSDGGKTKRAARKVLSRVKAEKVKACAIDMWEPFYKACLEAFPRADIVIDRFHVLKKVNEALDAVRSQVRGYTSSKTRREALFKHKRLLLMGMEDLSPKQEERLWKLLAWDKRLKLAYELKEVLRSVYAGDDPLQGQGRVG